jgi:hypothetical protein
MNIEIVLLPSIINATFQSQIALIDIHELNYSSLYTVAF